MALWEKSIKIAIAACLAIYVAQFFSLDNPLSAGIIAILSVLDTRQDTIQTAMARFLSTVLAFIIATIVFHIWGYNVLAFGLYLIIYVPLAYRFGLNAGIAPCSVLVTHFMLAESTSLSWQINGLSLMAIGVLSALFMQIWMPSREEDLTESVKDVEDSMREVLINIAEYLEHREEDMTEVDTGLKELEEKILNLRSLALDDYNNQFIHHNDYYLQYSRMRYDQYNILEQMVFSLKNIKLHTEQNNILASMYRQTAEEFHEHNTGVSLLQNISDLYKYFRESDLPTSREEFESRALLYQVLIEFETFLEVKHDFYLKRSDKSEAIEAKY